MNSNISLDVWEPKSLIKDMNCWTTYKVICL